MPLSPVTVKERTTVKDRFKNLDISSAYAIVLRARKGIKPKIFYDLAQISKMPEKMLASLINISARTISNYQERQKSLEPIYSEHLLKLISLYDKGEDLFGSVDEFNYWLRKPFWNGKETPLDWINTPGGVDLVMEQLDQLAHGYPL